MAKRRTHKSRKSYKPHGAKTLYGKCLSKALKGHHPKGKAAKSKLFKGALRKCRPILCRKN